MRCRAGLGTRSTDLGDPSRVPAPPCPQRHVMRITPRPRARGSSERRALRSVAIAGWMQKSVLSQACDRERESENINWGFLKDLLFLNFLYKC